MRRYVFRYALVAGMLFAPAMAWADKAEDAQIGQTIAQKLQEEKKAGGLKGFALELQVEEGTVWLSGHVASPEQQTKALDLARRVKGVKQVVNDITVNAAPAKSAAAPKPATPKPAEPAKAKFAMDGGISQSQNMRASMNLPVEPAAATSPTPITPVPTIPAGPSKPVPMISPVQQTPVSSILRSEIGSGVAPSTAATAPGVQYIAARPTPVSPIAPNPGYGYGPTPSQSYARSQVPMAVAPSYIARQGGGEYGGDYGGEYGAPVPMHTGGGMGIAPARYDHPQMPNHAWPSYAAYPNYAAVTYPKQYSPTAWPYIGPFYPYPQVPLGWRKVTMEWDDGWWFLDFKNRRYR
jgi:hypothetical protein